MAMAVATRKTILFQLFLSDMVSGRLVYFFCFFFYFCSPNAKKSNSNNDALKCVSTEVKTKAFRKSNTGVRKLSKTKMAREKIKKNLCMNLMRRLNQTDSIF